VIARYGALVAVTDGRAPGPDPLLQVVAETAEAGGDGSELVIKAARAALGASPQAGWACAGVTADGGLAVLVYGHAAATVRAGSGPEVTLAVSDSKLPVSRTFTGDSVTAILVISGAAPPDERFRLGDGVVQGGGLALTVTADRPQPATRKPGAQPARPQPNQQPQPVRPQPGQQPQPARPQPVKPQPGQQPQPARPQPARQPQPAQQPQSVRRQAAPAGRHHADPPKVAETVLDMNPTNVLDDPGQPGWHPPTTLSAPAAGPPAPKRPSEEPARDPVLVDGALCANGHFNDPRARLCRQCGIAIEQPPRHFDRRPRPPLGELVVDDGTKVTLDGDYVLGREPTLDGDVLAGRARPLRINDPNGTVSRLHLKISLVGWQVEVSDLGSANGSVLHSPDGERTLAPFEPAAIEPGARIGIGHRTMQYLAYQGA